MVEVTPVNDRGITAKHVIPQDRRPTLLPRPVTHFINKPEVNAFRSLPRSCFGAGRTFTQVARGFGPDRHARRLDIQRVSLFRQRGIQRYARRLLPLLGGKYRLEPVP